MNGSTVEIIKVIILQTKSDDATVNWRAVLHYLGHGREHMLTILTTIWRSGFEKHMHVKGGLAMTSSSYEIQSLESGSSSRISPFDLFN